jgi:TonB family protein
VKIRKQFWLIFLVFAISHSYAQELIEAKCYGGKQQLKAFLNAEMVYPEKALKNNTEGTVVIYYVVDEKGKVVEQEIALSVSPELDSEALRLFSKILWQPGTLYGNPVSMKQSFPLKFDIKKYNRLVKKRGYDKIEYPTDNVDTSDKIYDLSKVETLPQPVFEEKDMTLAKFISDNTKYPESAFKQNINGTVKVLFVIEPSGNISNCMIRQHVGGGCNEEAKRVISLIDWDPGLVNGKAVRTMLVLGITFGGGTGSSFEYFPAHHGSTMQ